MLSERLGCFSIRLGGPFYSPKAARSHWRQSWKANLAFCRVVHRTVQCTTGQLLFMSGARFFSIWRTADHWSSGSVGAPGTVRCTPNSPMCPTDRWRDHVSREDYAADRCAGDRWLTGQSGAPPDSPMIFSRTPPSKPESSKFTGDQPGAPDTVRCPSGQSSLPD
jgi:hypothetical protein